MAVIKIEDDPNVFGHYDEEHGVVHLKSMVLGSCTQTVNSLEEEKALYSDYVTKTKTTEEQIGSESYSDESKQIAHYVISEMVDGHPRANALNSAIAVYDLYDDHLKYREVLAALVELEKEFDHDLWLNMPI